MAALDEADVPALIDHVLNEAAMAGVEHFYVPTPTANPVAVGHLLARGARIDPFTIMVLGNDR